MTEVESRPRNLYAHAKRTLKNKSLYSDEEFRRNEALSIFFGSADSYLELNHPKAALKVLDKVKTIYEQDSKTPLPLEYGKIHFYRGLALAKMGKQSEAEEELRDLEKEHRKARQTYYVENAFSQEIEDLRTTLHKKDHLNKNLTSRLSSVIAIVGVLGGIFFLSNSITGNAIASLSNKTTSFLGAGLLIIGLVAGFFWLKSKKK